MSGRAITPEASISAVVPPTPVSLGPEKKNAAKSKAAASKVQKVIGSDGTHDNQTILLWTVAVTSKDMDWDLIVKRTGYKNVKSAKDTWAAAKKKYLNSVHGQDLLKKDDGNDGNVEADATPAKAAKRKAKDDGDEPAKPKRARKAAAKKVKKEEYASDLDAEEED